MNKVKIAEVKELVKTTFPDFSQEELKDITPTIVRQYIKRKLPEDVLFQTAVLVPSRISCWIRIERLCNYLKTVRYWASL
jgi:uncharacterized membrane protein YheB (UPF0754 family)